MDIKNFLDTVCEQIKYKPVRESISEELKNHIEEIKEEYMNEGIPEKDAEEKAVAQMGVAEEIGKKLNKVHKPKLDWKLLILIIILIGFGLLVAFLQQSATNHIKNTIIYMMIGIALSIGIYFFDYRKINKYSNLVYIMATIIMILPFIGMGTKINGLNYASIGSISFMPCTVAVPLYLIAFIGYMTNYNKENVIKIQIEEEEFKINKDFIKIIVLSIVSLLLIINIPSFANAAILGLAYLVIITIKIAQNKEKRVKSLIKIYGSMLIFAIAIISIIITEPYRSDRIVASFKPEIDPQGSGYTGMLQKEIMENAKLIGEAETRVISNEDYIISLDSNYTFIYLLGKTGRIVSGILVLTIILISIKMIINAKDMRDIYGKMLIIGLSTLYISQSVASVLMNINLGVKAGINLPIVSYGGVYFIINMMSIGIILSVYRRKDINRL